MKKAIISLVLVLSMLLSFGLCTLSISATPIVNDLLLDVYGYVYNAAMNVHVQLGTYHNTFATTNEPFTSYYYVETDPDYYNQALYSSRLQATSSFETFYEIESRSGGIVEMPISDTVFEASVEDVAAQFDGWDYNTTYVARSQNTVGVGVFCYRIINTVYSTVTNEFMGVYTTENEFYFDSNGVSLN